MSPQAAVTGRLVGLSSWCQSVCAMVGLCDAKLRSVTPGSCDAQKTVALSRVHWSLLSPRRYNSSRSDLPQCLLSVGGGTDMPRTKHELDNRMFSDRSFSVSLPRPFSLPQSSEERPPS